MSNPTTIPNEQQLMRSSWGVEARRGVTVAPTAKYYGALMLTKSRPLADRQEYAGTFFSDYTPVWGPETVEGTYQQSLTFEDWPMLWRYGVRGAPVGVTDSESTPGYTYTATPDGARDNIDTAAVEYGVPGMPWQCNLLHFPEHTISADIDDAEAAWKFNAKVFAKNKDLIAATTGTATGGSTSTVIKSGAAWTVNQFTGAFVTMVTGTAGNIGIVREIASNTATTLTLVGTFPSAVVNTDTFEISGAFTAGLTDRTRETIPAPNTLLYLDDTLAIGTTPVNNQFISFSHTHMINSYGKRFMENATGYGNKLGRGATRVSGQIRLEFDTRKEYDKWIAKTVRKIRIRSTGSAINANVTEPNRYAQIDVYAGYWDTMGDDTRQNNLTVTWGYRGYVDATQGVPVKYFCKSALATLP